MNKFILMCMTGALSFLLISCASVKKADIPSTANPQEEVSRLETDINAAMAKNIDVLAPDEFKESRESLNEAKSDLAAQKSQEEVLDNVRVGRGYLEKAYSMVGDREAQAPGLFAARQAALKAGASQHPELQGDLRDLDSDLSSKAGHLHKVSADKLTELQQQYVDLERRAVIIGQLGNAKAIIKGVQKDNAKLAPVTLKKAELSLKNAESVVSTNVRNPAGYQKAVADANADANLLMEVTSMMKQDGKSLTEPAALKIVAQNAQIKNLKNNLSATEAQSAEAQSALQDKNARLASELSTKDKDLASASAQVEFQAILEKARSQFSPDEAEAYQQGDSLLIRLKKINFASGRSDIPATSLPVLAKVSEVAKSLNASGIKVEGHTDSVGSENTNKSISVKRADAVASYLKNNGFDNVNIQSEGYGFEKPIATNKSKEGRAQNRRVDVIITPEGAVSTQ